MTKYRILEGPAEHNDAVKCYRLELYDEVYSSVTNTAWWVFIGEYHDLATAELVIETNNRAERRNKPENWKEIKRV